MFPNNSSSGNNVSVSAANNRGSLTSSSVGSPAATRVRARRRLLVLFLFFVPKPIALLCFYNNEPLFVFNLIFIVLDWFFCVFGFFVYFFFGFFLFGFFSFFFFLPNEGP